MPAADDIFKLLSLAKRATEADAGKADRAAADQKMNALIWKIDALRAVAEAANMLATTAQLAARHMPAGTIADLINDVAKVRAALDRVREGGGG